MSKSTLARLKRFADRPAGFGILFFGITMLYPLSIYVALVMTGQV